MKSLNQNIPPSSLRLNLTVACVTVLLLTVSLSVMLYFSHQALRQEAIHDAEQTLDGTVQNIDNILLGVEQTTDNIYQDLKANLDHPDRMETYCRRIVECNPYIAGCAIMFEPYYYKGREQFVSYVYRDGSTFIATDSLFFDTPYTERAWYKEPMRTGHACWTDPFINDDVNDEALTTFCMPILDLGSSKTVGVIAVDLSVSLLSQTILSSKSSPNSYCVLLGSNGSYIVHPDAEKLSRRMVFTQTEEDANATMREAAEAMMKGETGYKTFRMSGEDWYVFYVPIHRDKTSEHEIAPLGWSVGEICPDDDILGSYYWLRYTVLVIAVIGLLLFFVLCRLVIRKQMQPLRMLTRSAQRIAEGNFYETIPPSEREDEVGQLQDHFQQMQQSLAAHINELDQLQATLEGHSEALQKASGQTQETDRVKSAFLHYITNQMFTPSDIIHSSVTKLSNYHDLNREEVEQEVDTVKQQGGVILDLLSHIIQAVQIENGKGGQS